MVTKKLNVVYGYGPDGPRSGTVIAHIPKRLASKHDLALHGPEHSSNANRGVGYKLLQRGFDGGRGYWVLGSVAVDV